MQDVEAGHLRIEGGGVLVRHQDRVYGHPFWLRGGHERRHRLTTGEDEQPESCTEHEKVREKGPHGGGIKGEEESTAQGWWGVPERGAVLIQAGGNGWMMDTKCAGLRQ